MCRVLGNGIAILLFIAAMVVGVGLICYFLVEIVEGLLKEKDTGTIRKRVFLKTLLIMLAVMISSVFPSIALSYVDDSFSMDNFGNSFPTIFALLSFYVSIIVSLTTYLYQKKEGTEKDSQNEPQE